LFGPPKPIPSEKKTPNQSNEITKKNKENWNCDFAVSSKKGVFFCSFVNALLLREYRSSSMATFDFQQSWNILHEGLQLVMDICLNIELKRRISPAEWTTFYKYIDCIFYFISFHHCSWHLFPTLFSEFLPE
jgi:hypothetical protein